MEVGDEILIRARVIGKEKDPNYPAHPTTYREYRYEVEISPDFDSIYLIGNELDNVEVVSSD